MIQYIQQYNPAKAILPKLKLMISFIFSVFPDDGEPAPNIEEYSSISNYDDYDTDTNSSAAYE